MSADNGIYILITDGPEYRIKHLQAGENLWWDDSAHAFTEDPEIILNNAREMWKDCAVFTVEPLALAEAFKEHQRAGWTEYGISLIDVKGKF